MTPPAPARCNACADHARDLAQLYELAPVRVTLNRWCGTDVYQVHDAAGPALAIEARDDARQALRELGLVDEHGHPAHA